MHLLSIEQGRLPQAPICVKKAMPDEGLEPPTRGMIGDAQGSDGSGEGSQARIGDLSSTKSREFGARSGARRKRKQRKR